MKRTRTFAMLAVPRALYDFVAAQLRAAGYEHAFVRLDDDVVALDLHGIALIAEAPAAAAVAGADPVRECVWTREYYRGWECYDTACGGTIAAVYAAFCFRCGGRVRVEDGPDTAFDGVPQF